MVYDYSYISAEMLAFKNTFSIGRTIENRHLYCCAIGEGKECAVFAGCFHGLEFLTAASLIEFIKSYSMMNEYHKKLKVYVIPMVNPDGVHIALHGLNPKNVLHRRIIETVGIMDFKNIWQANSMGVDINHNFDADWKSIFSSPQPTRYGGEYPESEVETRSVVRFLKKAKPELFIAFHSQGKEIYYDFNGLENKRAKATATTIAKKCGYTVSRPVGAATFGGAKDWYIKEYHKQAFTVELGKGKNPLPLSELEQMAEDTKTICTSAIDEIF